MRPHYARLGFIALLVISGTIGLLQEGGAQASVRPAAPCVTVGVKATPSVNTAMIPETIQSTFTSCASAAERITAKVTISGPTRTALQTSPSAHHYRINLLPGQKVHRSFSFPYACCGTYTVVLKAFSLAGHSLGSASTQFTFA